MSKIAVMGDYDSIYGFAALGLDIFPVTDKEEGGLFFTDSWATQLPGHLYDRTAGRKLSADREEYAEQVFPAIILIPGVFGNTGEGIPEGQGFRREGCRFRYLIWRHVNRRRHFLPANTPWHERLQNSHPKYSVIRSTLVRVQIII